MCFRGYKDTLVKKQHVSSLPEKLLDCSAALRVTFLLLYSYNRKNAVFVIKYQQIQSNRQIYLNYAEEDFW